MALIDEYKEFRKKTLYIGGDEEGFIELTGNIEKTEPKWSLLDNLSSFKNISLPANSKYLWLYEVKREADSEYTVGVILRWDLKYNIKDITVFDDKLTIKIRKGSHFWYYNSKSKKTVIGSIADFKTIENPLEGNLRSIDSTSPSHPKTSIIAYPNPFD